MHCCRVPGCGRPVSRWGAYCNTHKSRNRRHGHPQQEAITAAALAPFIKKTKERMRKSANAEALTMLIARWDALVTQCRAVIAAYLGGKPSQRNLRHAAQAIVCIADDVDAREVADVALALYLMQDQQPQRFRSDNAFLHQMVRRLRGLTERNVGTWFDEKSGTVKRVYRDLTPKTANLMGRMLAEVFGVAGLRLAQLERLDLETRQKEARDFSRAMQELV